MFLHLFLQTIIDIRDCEIRILEELLLAGVFEVKARPSASPRSDDLCGVVSALSPK